jgi:hypothetical protein
MMRKIGWYFLIFFFILVAFTHALLYALHTRQYKPCEGKSCETTDNPSSYPTDFGRALSATIFFLVRDHVLCVEVLVWKQWTLMTLWHLALTDQYLLSITLLVWSLWSCWYIAQVGIGRISCFDGDLLLLHCISLHQPPDR